MAKLIWQGTRKWSLQIVQVEAKDPAYRFYLGNKMGQPTNGESIITEKGGSITFTFDGRDTIKNHKPIEEKYYKCYAGDYLILEQSNENFAPVWAKKITETQMHKFLAAEDTYDAIMEALA